MRRITFHIKFLHQLKSGIRERHIADETQATSDLAVIAGQRALIDAGIDSGDVDMLILSTLCPDFMTTSAAPIFQEKLGMKNAAAFDLNIACSGFVYAVTIGSQFIASGMHKKQSNCLRGTIFEARKPGGL